MLGDATGLGTPGIVLYAIALGGLAFLNTWDFPVYVGLAVLALGSGWALAGGLSLRRGRPGHRRRRSAGGVGLAALSAVLPGLPVAARRHPAEPALPFPLQPVLRDVRAVPGGAVCFLALLTRETSGRRVLRGFLGALPWTLLVPLLLLGFVVLGMAVLPQGKALVQEMLNNPAVQANIADRTLGGLVGLVVRLRVATPWTYLVLAVLIAWAAGLVWAGCVERQRSRGAGERRSRGSREEQRSRGARSEQEERSRGAGRGRTSAPQHLRSSARLISSLLLMIGLALLLALAPEFVYLRDLFGSRMNTVFKFYYQAWLLLALASAYGLSRLAERGTALWLKLPALILAGVLTLGGLWYPLAAIPSKADNFRGQPTLDGLAYLRRANPGDVAAIEWLRANVAPDAVVLEATGGSYSPEGAGRVSMSTGNPTLLGWDFHERQWRGNEGYDKLAAGRPDAINQIYRTARPRSCRDCWTNGASTTFTSAGWSEPSTASATQPWRVSTGR